MKNGDGMGCCVGWVFMGSIWKVGSGEGGGGGYLIGS